MLIIQQYMNYSIYDFQQRYYAMLNELTWGKFYVYIFNLRIKYLITFNNTQQESIKSLNFVSF